MVNYYEALQEGGRECEGGEAPMMCDFASWAEGTAAESSLWAFARRRCVHFDMVVAAALPVLAERCNRAGVNVVNEEERQPLNLSHLIFAPRAMGKSQTRRFLTGVLQEEDRAAAEAYREESGGKKLTAEERLARKKSAVYKVTHLVSDSPTMAAFTAQLEGQTSSLIFTDEGHIFLNALLAGRKDATQLLAALHDGADYVEARLTREDRRVHAPRVCTCLMMQPYYAREILTQEAVMGGLLSRFLIFCCASRPAVAEQARGKKDPRAEWAGKLREFGRFLATLPRGADGAFDVRPDKSGERALKAVSAYESAMHVPDDTRDLFLIALTRLTDKALRLGGLRALLCGRVEIKEEDVALSVNLLLGAAEGARELMPAAQIPISSKTAALKQLFNAFPDAGARSDTEVARLLGCSRALVYKVRKGLL